MKIILILVFFILYSVGFTQNLLSPIWKINTKNEEFSQFENTNSKKWPEVNLLLSWERQGYSWIDGNCLISNEFLVTEDVKELKLSLSLQCDIQEIYVNNNQVGGNISNLFWSDRGRISEFIIEKSDLKADSVNRITIKIANLSYTGGLSHNFCSINPIEYVAEFKVEFIFPNQDHVYTNSNNTSFKILTTSSENGEVSLVIKNDFHEVFLNETISVNKGIGEIKFDLTKYNLQPGFYECTAILSDGSFVGTAKWFAIQPEQIKCANETVAGFDTYWAEALTELNTIAPNFKMHKVDSLCSASRNGFVVEMQSLGNLTIRGYYFLPKTEGKHPVVLHLPGYSYGFDYLDGFINRKGNVAELALCVRGHGISADVFNPWEDQTLWSVNVCSKEKNVYRSVYMDCVRAIDFLLSRPEINNTKIGVAGGSQGGGLTLATAGLCNDNVAACAFFDPFLCDIRDQVNIRTIVKREFELFTQHKDNNCDVNQILHVQDYMDTKGFAPKIRCPVYFEASLFDDDCPVHCGFVAYNKIQSQKSYRVYPNDSHLGESGQYDNLFNEVVKLLNE
jgi:cephalosporin-C deacetylase-like acetyl esterase